MSRQQRCLHHFSIKRQYIKKSACKGGFKILFAIRFKIQRHRIHTKPFMCGRWTIVKYMTEMGITPGAFHLYSFHAKGVVRLVNHAVFPHRFKKAGPSAFAGELSIRAEEFVAANSTVIGAFRVAFPVFAGESSFGALLPRYVVEVTRQDFFPFIITHIQMGGVCTGVIWIISVCSFHIIIGLVCLSFARGYKK